MKHTIETETIKEVLSSYYKTLETNIFHIKHSYNAVSKDLPIKYRQLIINRIKVYLEAINKTKEYCLIVESLIEKDERLELLRVCKLILQLNDFIREDTQDLVIFIDTGKFPTIPKKVTLH